MFRGPLRDGAQRAGRTLADLDLSRAGRRGISTTTTLRRCGSTPPRRRVRVHHRSDGCRGRNFYNDAFTRLGYGTQAAAVADLWQSGRRDEARAAVPIDLGRLTNLVGTPGASPRSGPITTSGSRHRWPTDGDYLTNW